MSKPKLDKNSYIEICNPIQKNDIPVRVLKNESDGILVKILANGKSKFFYYYYLEEYGYRLPILSDVFIESCGFKKTDNYYFERDNLIVAGCFVVKTNRDTLFEKGPTSIKFFGYKFIERQDLSKFKEKCLKTKFETTLENYKKEHETITSVEEFIRKAKDFGLKKIDFDNVILKQCK